MISSYTIPLGSFKKIKNGSTIVVLGPRNTGKTTVLRTILYYLNPEIRIPILISNTAHVSRDFNGMIPESLSYQRYDPDMMKKIMRYQVRFFSKINEHERKNPPFKTYMMIVMDDVFAQGKKFKNDETFIEIFTEGRQSNITIIAAFHDAMGVPPKVRGQIDYLIITKEHRKKRLQEIYDNYWPFKTDINTFKEILSKCTNGYNSMLIDLRHANKPGFGMNNTVFYLEPPNPDFLPKNHIGIRSIWDEHFKRLDPEWRRKKWLNNPKGQKHKIKRSSQIVLEHKQPRKKKRKNTFIFKD